jgi:Tol biopolymer transport system component
MKIPNQPSPKHEDRDPDEDQIYILTADHTSRVVPLHKPGVTIGSEPENDIVLDDPQVSQYHARIESEDGHYRILDLNSSSGTYLGDLRLHAGTPVEWDPEKALRIGENWIGLRISGKAGPEGDMPGLTLPKIDSNLIRWGIGKQIGVYVFSEQIAIAPGKSGVVAMILYNHGQYPVHLNLKVSGVPADWVGSVPTTVVLPKESERQVTLGFQLPQSPTTRIGRHGAKIRVTCQEMPIEQVEFTLALTVLPFSRFSSMLYPGIQGDSLNYLKIDNLGNTPETFFITANDPSGKLNILLSSEQCNIAEGESARVDLTVSTPVDLLSARGRTYPFTLQVRSAAGQAQTLDASVIGRGYLPYWLVPIFVITLLGLCGLLIWGLVGYTGKPSRTPTPSPTATAVIDTDGDGLMDGDEILLGTNPRLVDTDGDGLLDGEEQRAGTNPLVVDTDGDTLTDGREVLELHTSPVNPDTDGDGLLDNVDPDPGRLPTFTPIPPTATPVPPTPTLAPPTETPPPPSPTSPSPTPLPTDTPLPTATMEPPTDTLPPPTATSEPPTATPPAVNVSGWIAFESRRDGNLEIYLYRADTQSELRLTNNASDDLHLDWSRTGNRMAFDTDRDGNSEIYAMNTDGTGLARLTDNPAHDFNPVWSPDGSRLAFLSDRDGNVEIYSMGADGSDQTRLSDSPSDECCLQWSPLGNMIAFMSNQTGLWGLYRMSPDGGDLVGLALASSSPPAWSPDGSRLAFVSDRDGNAEIYAVNNDGTGESRLTSNSAQDFNPVWSPNGSLIAFISNRDGNFEIYVMNPDGSGQTRLSDSVSNECCLVWSPDGTQLAFASDIEGNLEIYVVNVNNQGVLRLTNNPAYDAPLAWRP